MKILLKELRLIEFGDPTGLARYTRVSPTSRFFFRLLKHLHYGKMNEGLSPGKPINAPIKLEGCTRETQ